MNERDKQSLVFWLAWGALAYLALSLFTAYVLLTQAIYYGHVKPLKESPLPACPPTAYLDLTAITGGYQ